MTREELVPISAAYWIKGNLEFTMLYKLFSDYLEEIDKEEYQRIKEYLVQIISACAMLPYFSDYIETALNYFEPKFSICKLYSGNVCIQVY